MFGLGQLAALPPADRTSAVEALLETGGEMWRRQVGAWITRIVPVEVLVPDAAARWRPLVLDAIQFVFSRLSRHRLAVKLVEQSELPADTPPEQRLVRLISRMPALQKMGQVLARNRRLAPALRSALIELENGMSDMTPGEVHALIAEQLGPLLQEYSVRIEPSILSEASVGAVVRFTWRDGDRERERGVFKVLKPYVLDCLTEDMDLLRQLGEYLACEERGYGFAVHDVQEMLEEVRLLLQHELDFGREQATLAAAARTYRASIGIRVPRLFAPLCTTRITAMSDEKGVKVTAACRRSPVRRSRIAEQLVEALIGVPLFSREEEAVFHGDPHAGNLLYDEPNRELVVIDWALAERLSQKPRRQLILLALMTILRNPAGVSEAIEGLGRGSRRLIRRRVAQFFKRLPESYSPGILDAMRLLDDLALDGISFPPALFLFRKMLFTLDGVLHDVSATDVRIDQVIAREFLTRWAASFGLFYAPLEMKDLAAVSWNALVDTARQWSRKINPFGRPSGARTRSRKPGSPRPEKHRRPALPRRSSS